MSTVTTAAEAARRELGSAFEGELIGPEDPAYEEARQVYNAMIDKRPALIARPTRPGDVASVVAFARDRNLPLAIRGGGHNGAGLGTVDDGVVIDLSLLKDIQVDPQARTVRVGGGCTWGEVDRATNEHGLATPSGIIGTTGVGGLTLGGGLGHLTRKHGLAIDNLLEAEMVLASGDRVRASADEHPDLFWAIRGGGGNFGVVTSFRFRLHEVDNVVAGPTFWPVESAAEVLSVYRDFLPAAPRDLNGFFAFATVPPAPPFPEEIPDEAVQLHAKFGAEMPTMKSTMHLYPIDGAAHDVGPSDTAWSYREARWATTYAGVDPDPANVDAIRRWSIDYQEALHPYSAGGAYVNMMMEEGQDRVRASYRDNYDRLVDVKRKYDPTNLFRRNQNIQP